MIKILPDMPKAKAHWEPRRRSKMPDFIMVPMSDGTVARYNLEVKQPGFQKIEESLKKLEALAYGYPRE